MGFLLGEVLEFVIRSYTDSDNQVEIIKIHISESTHFSVSLFLSMLRRLAVCINNASSLAFVKGK